MATIAPPPIARHTDYPESDGEPMAETDLHVNEILALIAMLKDRYRAMQEVYVAGNNFIYYEEGEPASRFSPDVYVVFGVSRHPRRTYRLWEEGRPPTVVIEVSSRKTWLEDEGNKKTLCARLGVAEYFIYDPAGEYLAPPLQGFQLKGKQYQPIPVDDDGALISKALDLKLQIEGGRIQLIDAARGERLLRMEELQAARREAEERATAEHQARRQAEARAAAAEAEAQRLRDELQRLKGQG
jgi:Uma2 family endonuclease